MSEPFVILNPGRKVKLTKEWQKVMGFTEGRILRLVSTTDQAIVGGGHYTIEKLDGAEDVRDLTPDLHRLCFVPVSNSITARNRRHRLAKAGC